MSYFNNNLGFSMIELIIAVSIMVILTSVAYLSYSKYLEDTENARNQIDAEVLQTEVELDFLKREVFPTSIQ